MFPFTGGGLNRVRSQLSSLTMLPKPRASVDCCVPQYRPAPLRNGHWLGRAWRSSRNESHEPPNRLLPWGLTQHRRTATKPILARTITVGGKTAATKIYALDESTPILPDKTSISLQYWWQTFFVLLLRNARFFFINPPTKKSGTILKFGTLQLAECKKCSCFAIGKRYF